MARENLKPNEVHVWLLWHRDAPADTDRFISQLSVDEKERAARYLNDRAKYEYCLTRSSLRRLLARYHVANPSDFEFVYGEHGKPALVPNRVTDGPPLQFNVAHTRHLSAFAFSLDSEVGVDVEFQRNVNDSGRIVESKFAAEERVVYAAAPTSTQKEFFFRGWTRKEAFIKATGEGLCRSLESFAVSIDGDANLAKFLRIDDDAVSHWSLGNLSLGDEHSGAIAVRNGSAKIVTREWHLDRIDG